MNRRLGIAGSVLIAVAGALAFPLAALAQTIPLITVDRTGTAEGEEVQVEGAGWPEGTTVIVELCGHEAREGSVDCDVSNQRVAGVRQDGSFRSPLTVGVPPSPCPCVIRAVDQKSAVEQSTPIRVKGLAEVTLDDDQPPPVPVELTGAEVVGGSRPAEWFGARPERMLEVTATNTSDEPVDGLRLSVVAGKGADPSGIVESPSIGVIRPGASQVLEIPVELEPLSFGSYTIVAELSGSFEPVSVRTSTSSYPWGLVAVAVLMVQFGLLAVRNRIRRRYRAQQAIITDEAALEIASGAPLAALTTGDEISAPALDVGPDHIVPLGPSYGPLQEISLTSDDEVDLTESTPNTVAPVAPVTVADPYEADTTRAVAASTALAARLRHETDLALLDHHEQAVELAANLRRDAAEQTAVLLASVRDAHDQLTAEISSTRGRTDEVAGAAAEEAAALLDEARTNRDAAKAVLDEAAAHAHLVIGAAEAQAARFEEIEERWRSEEAAIAERRNSQLDELKQLEARLQDVRDELEGRAHAISEDAELRSQLLVEHAASTEAELRDEAHRSLVGIVAHSAQVSAAQVFAAASPPPVLEPVPEALVERGPAHLAEVSPRRRIFRRSARTSSGRRSGT